MATRELGHSLSHASSTLESKLDLVSEYVISLRENSSMQAQATISVCSH